MVPVTADGDDALSFFSKAQWPSYVEEVDWAKGRVVIIDNWRVLHGRGSAKSPDQDRILLRILIE
jgi:alpha-ketoglutarate-dependent taurine dioxygenase